MFPFLSTHLISGVPNDKVAVATHNEMVVSKHDIYLNDMVPCKIEKANELLQLHTLGFPKSFGRILMKTVDSVIVIIVIAAFRKILSIKELWIKVNPFRFIPNHDFFHAVSGYPTTWSISGKGRNYFRIYGR